MTDKQTPPDWVLIEAAKRGGYSPEFRWLKAQYEDNPLYRALCDMIERYEARPVDRKLLCAREAGRESGYDEDDYAIGVGVRAIELWESGYGS
jgi:hypothetical protein